MQNDNGYIHTKLGFAGYNTTITKSYPDGQPNLLIARAVLSGTSLRIRIPFIRKAVQRAKKRAEEAMAKRLDEEIKNAMKD